MTDISKQVYYMNRRPLIYEGQQKNVYDGYQEGTHLLHFKDTLFLNKKSVTVKDKGIINNRISACIFQYLNDLGLVTHFVQQQNDREQLVHALEMIPIVVKVRNIAAGSVVHRLGVTEGVTFGQQVTEFYSKIGSIPSPLITEGHITSLGWAAPAEVQEMVTTAQRVNDFVTGFFASVGITCVDIALEFGRFYNPILDDTQIMLADEISPDTCRLWDAVSDEKYGYSAGKTKQRLDKGYKALAKRLNLLPSRPFKNTGELQLIMDTKKKITKVQTHGHES